MIVWTVGDVASAAIIGLIALGYLMSWAHEWWTETRPDRKPKRGTDGKF